MNSTEMQTTKILWVFYHKTCKNRSLMTVLADTSYPSQYLAFISEFFQFPYANFFSKFVSKFYFSFSLQLLIMNKLTSFEFCTESDLVILPLLKFIVCEVCLHGTLGRPGVSNACDFTEDGGVLSLLDGI